MGDMMTETKECSPSTWCGIEASVNCLERASLCSMLVVPRSMGCPVLCMQAISSTVACHLPFTVLKTTSDSTCPSGSHQSVTKQIPLFLWTSSHTSIWVHGSTQPLKSSWRSWSINIILFCSIFMQISQVISHRVIMMSQKHCILIQLIGWWYMQSRCKTGMCTFQIIISLLVGPMMRAFWPPTSLTIFQENLLGFDSIYEIWGPLLAEIIEVCNTKYDSTSFIANIACLAALTFAFASTCKKWNG